MNNDYYIVGYGKHASTKLVPALEKLSHNISGIVSTKKLIVHKKYKVFRNLNEAILNSTEKSIFIIATPPSAHFSQINKILDAKRNIFVEKPIFISAREANFIRNRLKKNNLFIVELMMFKHTKLYEKFLNYWEMKRNDVVKLEVKFLIPSLPSNTFREEFGIASSPLYDIGCYIISLLIDIGIRIDDLKIKDVLFKESRIKKIIINQKINNIDLLLEFGLNEEYKNLIRLFTVEKSIDFTPFFYGRKVPKKIIKNNGSTLNEIIIDDNNAFEKILAIPNKNWLFNQTKRFSDIIKVNKILDDLSLQIEKKYNYNY